MRYIDFLTFLDETVSFVRGAIPKDRPCVSICSDFHAVMLNVCDDRLKDCVSRGLAECMKYGDGPVNMLDGDEHSYIQIAGMTGDQGRALKLMALVDYIGWGDLLSPYKMLKGAPVDVQHELLGFGLCSIVLRPNAGRKVPTLRKAPKLGG